MANTLEGYTGVRFQEIRQINGVKVITVSNQTNTAIPMEAFTSKMYYIADPRTGKIVHIAFYAKNGDIKHSIDLKFEKDGSLIPFKQTVRKGKIHTEGTHFHKQWPVDANGDKGRSSHDKDNIFPVNRYYKRFVNLAVKYNLEH